MTALLVASALQVQTGPKKGRRYEIGAALRIGRHPYNELSLPDPAVSRYHCWITTSDASIAVEDLGSSNGTFVNGERIYTKRTLTSGDRVQVGGTELVLAEVD